MLYMIPHMFFVTHIYIYDPFANRLYIMHILGVYTRYHVLNMFDIYVYYTPYTMYCFLEAL